MNLTDMTVIEQWQFLAAFLPILVGIIIQRGWSTRAQATVAVIVYVAYGLLGSILSGELSALSWGSFTEVVTSIMTVAIVGYVSYQTLWKAFPVPQFVEEKTGGDPMIEVIPDRNVA